MAAAEINAGGGVNDKKIELMVADTQGTPDAGRAAIRKLINRDRVLVIGGGFSNTATWAAISIAQKNKVPFVVNSDSANARKFFQKTSELGLKPVFRERFEAGADDFRPLLARAKEKNPDLIYAVADNVSSAALLVRQSRDLKLNPKLFIGGGNGFVQPEFAAQAGKASDHIVCPALWTSALPYPGAGKFHDKFIARFKIPPDHHGAEAYAGISVIADALKRTKVLAPGKVRDALTQTNLKTVLGPVKFSAYNNKSQQNKLPAFLVQWFNGQLQVVWPKNIAIQTYVYPRP